MVVNFDEHNLHNITHKVDIQHKANFSHNNPKAFIKKRHIKCSSKNYTMRSLRITNLLMYNKSSSPVLSEQP
jgi:hypothetical protein